MTSAITLPISQPASGAVSASSNATLRRLRTLERLYEQGYQNVVVDLTMRKLLEHQVREESEQLDQLRSELAGFEAQFGIPSTEFYAKYKAGEMGDSADVFEWQALYQMASRLAADVELLSREIERD